MGKRRGFTGTGSILSFGCIWFCQRPRTVCGRRYPCLHRKTAAVSNFRQHKNCLLYTSIIFYSICNGCFRHGFDPVITNCYPVNIFSKIIYDWLCSIKSLLTISNQVLFIALFVSLTIIGIVKILMVYFKYEQAKKGVTFFLVGFSIIAVLFLTMAREPYAITVTFLSVSYTHLVWKMCKAPLLLIDADAAIVSNVISSM